MIALQTFAIIFNDPDLEEPDVICKLFATDTDASEWAWSVALGKIQHPFRAIRLADDGAPRMPYSAAVSITVFAASCAD